jgi:hypothetical protein
MIDKAGLEKDEAIARAALWCKKWGVNWYTVDGLDRGVRDDEDAEHIANASPERVLEYVAEIRRLGAVLAECGERIREVVDDCVLELSMRHRMDATLEKLEARKEDKT